MNRRNAPLTSNLMRAINEVFARGFKDPRIRGLITVTAIELSGDFKRAKVKVTIYPEEHESLTMHGLKAATGMIRSKVSRRVRMREMPVLEFVIDEGQKEEAIVLQLLAKAREESEQRDQSFAGTPTPTAETSGTDPETPDRETM